MPENQKPSRPHEKGTPAAAPNGRLSVNHSFRLSIGGEPVPHHHRPYCHHTKKKRPKARTGNQEHKAYGTGCDRFDTNKYITTAIVAIIMITVIVSASSSDLYSSYVSAWEHLYSYLPHVPTSLALGRGGGDGRGPGTMHWQPDPMHQAPSTMQAPGTKHQPPGTKSCVHQAPGTTQEAPGAMYPGVCTVSMFQSCPASPFMFPPLFPHPRSPSRPALIRPSPPLPMLDPPLIASPSRFLAPLTSSPQHILPPSSVTPLRARKSHPPHRPSRVQKRSPPPRLRSNLGSRVRHLSLQQSYHCEVFSRTSRVFLATPVHHVVVCCA